MCTANNLMILGLFVASSVHSKNRGTYSAAHKHEIQKVVSRMYAMRARGEVQTRSWRIEKALFSVLPHLCCSQSKKALIKCWNSWITSLCSPLNPESWLYTEKIETHVFVAQYPANRQDQVLAPWKWKRIVYFLVYLLEDMFEKQINILGSIWRSWFSHTITFHFSFVILICDFEEYVTLIHHLIDFLAEKSLVW